MLAALLMAMTACGDDSGPGGATEPTDDSQTKDTLVIGMSTLLEQFDPVVAQPVAKVHLNLLYDHLVGINEDGSDVSKETGIFSDWTTSDSKVWTFTMRPGFNFSDGTPVTTEDIKFSLDRMEDPAVATSAYSTWFRGNVDTVEATSDTQVTITLQAPSFQLPLYLSSLTGNEGSVIPKAYFEEVGAEEFAANPIGSGPYKVADRRPGVSVTYEKVEGHPIVDGRYQTVEFRIVPESGTRRAQLETGELDVIDIGTADAREMEGSDGITIVEKPAGNQVGITFHQQWNDGSPFGDAKFREALVTAVNAEEVAEGIFGGFARVTGNYPSGPLALGHVELPPYEFDEDAARRLLEESTYDGQKLELYSFPLPGIPELTDIAQALQGYWSNIGVDVELIPAEYSTFVERWTGFTLDFAASPVSFAHRPLGLAYYENGFASTGGSTVTHDPDLDALIDVGRAAAADQEEYAAATAALDRYVYDNFLSLPIAELNSFYAAAGGIVWPAGQGQYDINVRALVS